MMKLRHTIIVGLVIVLVVFATFFVRTSEPVRSVIPVEPHPLSPGSHLREEKKVPLPSSREQVEVAPTEILRTDLDGQPALAPPNPADLSTTQRPPLADLLGAAGTKPEDEAAIVLDVLNAYRRLLGAFPAGEDNRQFVNALLGANKEKLPFLPFDHSRLNARGEIVDAWGTPFFFHLNSRQSVEVRSAGPDRLLFTPDDIVAGKPRRGPKTPVIPDHEPGTP